MIKYRGGAFGFQVLLRLHGSALFKAAGPAAMATVFFIIFFHFFDLHTEGNRIFDHPYPMGALIASFTFLLTFKTSFSYNRYWEAVTVVHQMHSKWLDVGMELAAFHLQSTRYKQPPSFGQFPLATSVKRERERLNEMTRQDLEDHLDEIESVQGHDLQLSLRHRVKKSFLGLGRSSRRQQQRPQEVVVTKSSKRHESLESLTIRDARKSINAPTQRVSHSHHGPLHVVSAPIRRPLRHIKRRIHYFDDNSSRSTALQLSKGRSIIRSMVPSEQFDPSLLLQEGAHLISLLSAVALSTLRNDLEEAESPLSKFEPGAPWPHVDSDDYAADVRGDWESTHRSLVVLRYLFGFTRTARARTLYNAARPFRVVGGVSDVEVEQLQKARGPLAKVTLCSMWLQEFIAREHLHQGLGGVGAPIVSRLFQYTSDGMIGYNQARKIAYIPFPFPHAQITSLYVLVMVVFVPILMLSFINNIVFGAILNFFTVLSFTGLYEVSRELENPFKNVPNDVPLNNFQAQFNEALMTMYNGYHPDAFWVVEEMSGPLPSLIMDDPEQEELLHAEEQDEVLPTEEHVDPPALHARDHDEAPLSSVDNGMSEEDSLEETGSQQLQDQDLTKE